MNNQRPPVQAAAATSGRHGDSSWHQSQGGVANPAYDKHGDHDLHAVSKKQTFVAFLYSKFNFEIFVFCLYVRN